MLLKSHTNWPRTWEASGHWPGEKRNSPHFIEPESLCKFLQDASTGPNPKAHEPSPHPHVLAISWRPTLMLSKHPHLRLTNFVFPSGFSTNCVLWVISGSHRGINRSSLFWKVTQRLLVVSYWRFGTTCRSHPQVWGRRMLATAWPLKMGPAGGPETSVTTNKRFVTSQKRENLNIVYSFLYFWLMLHDPPISPSLI